MALLSRQAAAIHVNLGTAWLSQKKLEQAVAEYTRAMELDLAATDNSKLGITAQITSPEQRAQYAHLLARSMPSEETCRTAHNA